MIRALPKVDRRRVRALARRQWRRIFIPIAVVNVEGIGRAVVMMRTMETRWSDSNSRRLWRPADLPLVQEAES